MLGIQSHIICSIFLVQNAGGKRGIKGAEGYNLIIMKFSSRAYARLSQASQCLGGVVVGSFSWRALKMVCFVGVRRVPRRYFPLFRRFVKTKFPAG